MWYQSPRREEGDVLQSLLHRQGAKSLTVIEGSFMWKRELEQTLQRVGMELKVSV